jgi:hypothetical protein
MSSDSISFPDLSSTSAAILVELLIVFPYFFYYRSFLILIIHPASSFSYCQFIIHIADKLIIKHFFNLVILYQKTLVTPWTTRSPNGLILTV